MRVTVEMLVEALNTDRTTTELLQDFPYLEQNDIVEALEFAADPSGDHSVPP